MSKRINYRNLAAEFIIVFVGVVVALAADSWREDFGERRLEKDYLDRLETELEVGKLQLEGIFDRFDTAFYSSEIVIEELESTSSSNNNALLIEHFTKATRTGGPGGGVSHSAIYTELISTGRLNLISDTELRTALTNYYRELDILSLEFGTLPSEPWARYRELTGHEAGYYLGRGEFPEGEAANRLISELRDGKLSVRQFRILRTRLGLLAGRLENQIEDNESLVEQINIASD